MRIHPFTKLFIFSLVVSVFSCVTAPKVTDIAELRFGDDEIDIVEKFGRGSSVLFFGIDGTIYHFRSYTTKHTGDTYAILFSNGKLISVAEEIPSYDKCITLDAKIDWEKCLLDFITDMRGEAIEMGLHDFSEAIDEQKHQETEAAEGTVLITAVAVPSVIVFWPFAVMCGGIAAVEEMSDDTLECHKILREVTEQSYILLSSLTDESVIDRLNGIHPVFVVSGFDEQIDDRRVINKTWRCKRKDNFPDLEDVEISMGIKSGRIVWMNLESSW